MKGKQKFNIKRNYANISLWYHDFRLFIIHVDDEVLKQIFSESIMAFFVDAKNVLCGWQGRA